MTERLDRSILRRDEKKASSSAHTRRSLLGVASSRATSRVASKRANSNEKNILLFDTHRDVLLHFIRVHLENNEEPIPSVIAQSRREDAPHLLTPIHELEHSELFSFAETVLREIDVDRHLEDFV